MRATSWIAIAIVILALLIAFMQNQGGRALVDFHKDGDFIASRGGLDLVEGTNVTISETDIPASNRVTYTINASPGLLDIKEDNVQVVGGASALDFGSGFDVNQSPTGEANVTLNSEESPFVDFEDEQHGDEHAGGGNDVLFTEKQATWVQSGDVELSMAVESIRLYASTAGTIKDVRCAVNTAPTTTAVIVDLNKNGASIFTNQANRPTIPSGSNTGVSPTPDVTTYIAGDFFNIEIDQEDSGDTAADLTCQMRVREALFDTN